MGAIGAALLAMENHQYTEVDTKFKGWEVGNMNFQSVTCQCTGCSNNCEVITILEGAEPMHHVEKIGDIKGNIIARWGGTCGRWDIAQLTNFIPNSLEREVTTVGEALLSLTDVGGFQ